MYIRLLHIAILITFLGKYGFSQFHFGSTDKKDYIIYYHFYNDVQMIEVDLNAWEQSKVDAMPPMGMIPIAPFGANPIIFRERSGKILKQYNTNKNFAETDFSTPGQVSGKTRPHRFHNYEPEKDRHYENRGFKNKVSKELPYKPCEKFRFVVYENGKYGVIDTVGAILLPVTYQDINFFAGNYIVKKNSKWGLLNSRFTTLIQPRYTSLSPIKNNLLLARDNSFGIIDTKGNILLGFEYDEIIPTKYYYFFRKSAPSDTFSHGQAYKLYGLINFDYRQITEPRYFEFRPFIAEYKETEYYFAAKSTGWGMIDKYGNEVSEFMFESEPFFESSGYFRADIIDTMAHNRRRRIIIDSNFNDISKIKYQYAGWFRNGIGAIGMIVGQGWERKLKYGLMDSKGELIMGYKYDRIRNYIGNFLIVEEDNKEGLIDSRGKEWIKPVYDHINTGKNLDTIFACLTQKLEIINNKKTWMPECQGYKVDGEKLIELD